MRRRQQERSAEREIADKITTIRIALAAAESEAATAGGYARRAQIEAERAQGCARRAEASVQKALEALEALEALGTPEQRELT